MRTLNDNQKHYLAGILDGECTVDIVKNKYPRLRVALVDRDLINFIAWLMETPIRVQFLPYPQQAIWSVIVTGQKAIDIMIAILPYMCSRRSGKIATVIAWSRDCKKYKIPALSHIKNHFDSVIKSLKEEYIC